MATVADECELSFYEELARLYEDRQFWLVRNRHTGKYYIKKILPETHKDVYDVLKGIDSQNLPKIYECLLIEDQLVVIEEFINGERLSDLKEQGKITPEYAVKIMIDICNVLFTLHSKKPPVIHRDIKPENVMLTSDGVVKLMDFNISRVYDREKNRDTEYMGTPGYAAPENYGFGQTDPRSDIYSCGVMLNYLLTGQMPEDRLAEGYMGFVVQKCTHIDVIKRYQNIFELREALLRGTENYNTGVGQHGNQLQPAAYQNDGAPDNVPVTVMENTAGKSEPDYARKWQRYLPPGFRSLKIWKMGIALFGYYTILQSAATYEVKDAKSQGEITLNRIFCGIGTLAAILVFFNYLGIADGLPGKDRTGRGINWGRRFLYAFLTLFSILCVLDVVVEIYNRFIL